MEDLLHTTRSLKFTTAGSDHFSGLHVSVLTDYGDQLMCYRVRDNPAAYLSRTALASHGRQRRLHLSAHAPCAHLIAEMITKLQAVPAPG